MNGSRRLKTALQWMVKKPLIPIIITLLVASGWFYNKFIVSPRLEEDMPNVAHVWSRKCVYEDTENKYASPAPCVAWNAETLINGVDGLEYPHDPIFKALGDRSTCPVSNLVPGTVTNSFGVLESYNCGCDYRGQSMYYRMYMKNECKEAEALGPGISTSDLIADVIRAGDEKGRAARQGTPNPWRQNAIHHRDGKQILDGFSMYVPYVHLLQSIKEFAEGAKRRKSTGPFTFVQVASQLGAYASSIGVLGPLLAGEGFRYDSIVVEPDAEGMECVRRAKVANQVEVKQIRKFFAEGDSETEISLPGLLARTEESRIDFMFYSAQIGPYPLNPHIGLLTRKVCRFLLEFYHTVDFEFTVALIKAGWVEIDNWKDSGSGTCNKAQGLHVTIDKTRMTKQGPQLFQFAALAYYVNPKCIAERDHTRRETGTAAEATRG